MVRYARYPLTMLLAASAVVMLAITLLAPRIPLPARPYAIPHHNAAVVEKVMVSRQSAEAAGTLQIARRASLDVIVANVDAAIGRASSIARRAGGDVFSLQAENDASANASADMRLRVPAAAFDASLLALAKLGTVKERTVDADDLTSNITDSAARLRNLQHTEEDILSIMNRSGSVSQILEAENQLSQVRERIEVLESQLKEMRGRVAYATIGLHFEPEAVRAAPDRSASARLRNATAAAVHALGNVTIGLVSTVIWCAVFVPYLLLVAAVLYAVRLLLRKRYAVRR